MRVLIDTNVLFSALLFPRSKPARALLHVADRHTIVLCDRSIAELRDILRRKAPQFLPDAEVLLAEMSYELIPAVDYAQKLIRDPKDQPILNAAIVSDVDVILTGDKDFFEHGDGTPPVHDGGAVFGERRTGRLTQRRQKAGKRMKLPAFSMCYFFFPPSAFLAARAARALAARAFLAALAALILAAPGWGASGVRRNSRLPMAGRSAKRV